MQNRLSKISGFSLVEVIIVSAITAMIFGALFSSFQYSLRVVSYSRAKLSAASVATERMEFFRSLPYADVGTVSGIPPGAIPQNSVITLNGVQFTERVLVEYVDDAADGLDVLDSNGILADYKRIKLEYSWEIAGDTSIVSLVSNIVPRSIETTAGGGTVRINVTDENSNFLPGASVRLINTTTGSPIDVTKISDANGIVLFSGAPAASGYEVIVNGNIAGKDYSTDQTYQITVANPFPVVAPFSVLESDISTLTFKIGELSDLNIRTLSAINEGMFREEFTNLTAVDTSNNVVVNAGQLNLVDIAGVHETTGSVYLGPITSIPLQNWQTARMAVSVPFGTAYKVQFFTGVSGGPYVLIPDGDLAGNAVGFTNNNIDISALDPIAYPSIFVGATLSTTDTSITPAIDEISVFYKQSETLLPNITFDIVGNKIIGTNGSGVSIPKYSNSYSTNGSGVKSLSAIEFDTYTIDPTSGYDIALACSANPFVQSAGVGGNLDLVLVANAASTLRVSVFDSLGQIIPGAYVRLERSGYDETILTNSCGQVFFTGGVSDDVDYTLTTTATGYVTSTVTPFTVNGDTLSNITLSQ